MLYLGHPSDGNRTVAPALAARNIDLLRAIPSEVHIDVHIEIKQVAYASYISCLPAFMKAWVSRKIEKITGAVGFPVVLPIDQCFPLRLPPMVVDFPARPNEQQLNVLATIGFEEITLQGNKHQMVFRDYTIDDVRTVNNMKANTIARCTVDTINIVSLRQLVVVQKIFSNFFKAHTYPAFSEGDLEIPFDNFNELYDIENQRKRKRSVTDEGENPRVQSTDTPGPDEDEDMEPIPPPLSPIQRINLYKAKPSRIEESCWGPVNTIPSLPGILCPFVAPLASNDKSGVIAVIRRYFFLCLGSTFADQTANLDLLKTAWGNINTTSAGDILSHMAVMIDIGLQAQARIFPVFDGSEYVGCVLSGCRFKLRTRMSLHVPVSHEQLLAEIGTAKFHTSVLNSIARMVGGDGEKRVTECTTMRQLSQVLQGSPLSEDAKDNIKKEAVHLVFDGQRNWAMNPTTIGKLISILGDISAPIDDKIPMHCSALFENDRVMSILSAFGYQAPTFMIPSCPVVTLREGSDPPHTFVFRAVSLSAAVTDWRRVLESKSITNNPSNLSKAHRDRPVSGGEKKSLWGQLTKCVNKTAAAQGVRVGFFVDTVGSGIGGEAGLQHDF